MRSLSAVAVGGLGVGLLWAAPQAEPCTASVPTFAAVVTAGPALLRYDVTVRCGGADRERVRRVRDLLQDRFDVDALDPTTPVTMWTVDGELAAFAVHRPAEEGGSIWALKGSLDDVRGTRDAWVLQDGTSLDGPVLARPVRYRVISSRIGLREHPVRHHMHFHAGTDYAAPVGTPVLAIADGVVKAASRSWTAGRFLVITHDDGSESKYFHLDTRAAGLAHGVRVHQGEVIGTVGRTGRVTGAHLHLEIRDRRRTPIDSARARWPGRAAMDDVHALQALAARVSLLETFGADGSRDPSGLLWPRMLNVAPVISEVSGPWGVPALAKVRPARARASSSRRRRLRHASPTFDAGLSSTDPLVRRAIQCAAEFPFDPCFG